MYTRSYEDVVVGIGEIGRPIYELLGGVYCSFPVDPGKGFYLSSDEKLVCDFLHICIPGSCCDFKEIVLCYTDKFSPKVVIIHSTVVPGTTSDINKELGKSVCVFSPVNGKHGGNNMKKDLLRYTKFIGGDEDCSVLAKHHLENVGFHCRILSSSTAVEWMKVIATTHFALEIAWAQEVERIAVRYGLEYEELTACVKEQEDIVPPHFPGVIGGHCLMSNIDLIEKVYSSLACKFIKKSNMLKELSICE